MKSSLKKVDYNIEFAHIYVNENFTVEHFTAASLVKNKIEELKKNNKSYSVTVLIDDYNPSESLLNVKKFIEELKLMGVDPDYVVFESKLVNLRDDLLKEMNGKAKRGHSKYIEYKEKCPCSFLVAAWYLLRLGMFKNKGIYKKNDEKPFIARNLITVLPQRYGSIEKKALSIIDTTKYGQTVRDSVEYIFF